MKKRLLLTLVLTGMLWISASAQSFYVDLNIQSFRPFIHFQLEVGNKRSYYGSYQSSYIKGYMDGVNSTYYSDYRFYDLVRQIDAYQTGYRDGQRDQQLFCRLHGYHRLHRRPFAYDDYYSPHIAVQIWLNDLTFSFLRAPERRLPRYWARRARPALRRYRNRFSHQKYFVRTEKRYQRNRKRLRKRAHNVRDLNRKRSHRKSRSRKLNKRKAIQHVHYHSLQKKSRPRRVSRSRNKLKKHIKPLSRHITRKASRKALNHEVPRKKMQHQHPSSGNHRAKHTRQKRTNRNPKQASQNRSHRSRRGHNH